MELVNINPFIRYARLHRSMGYNEPRGCYDCRLFVFCEGNGKIAANGREYSFSKGSAVFLPFGTVYHFDCASTDMVFYALDFDITDEHRNFAKSQRTPKLCDFDRSRILKTDTAPHFREASAVSVTLSKISEALSEICKLHLRKTPCYAEISSGLMKYVLCVIAASGDKSSGGLCGKVFEFIYENYADPELSNEKIAAHFGYHPYYLASLIKQQTGKSLHKHLVDFRLSAAADMLLGTSLDVGTISWKCGFSSVSHFIKCFREKEGVTPLGYRSKSFF